MPLLRWRYTIPIADFLVPSVQQKCQTCQSQEANYGCGCRPEPVLAKIGERTNFLDSLNLFREVDPRSPLILPTPSIPRRAARSLFLGISIHSLS